MCTAERINYRQLYASGSVCERAHRRAGLATHTHSDTALRSTEYCHMNSHGLDLASRRAQKARLGRRIGTTGYKILWAMFLLSLITAGTLAFLKLYPATFLALAASSLFSILALWYRGDLRPLLPTGATYDQKMSAAILGALSPQEALTTKSLWQAIRSHRQVTFMTNHFLIDKETITTALQQSSAPLNEVLELAARFATRTNSPTIQPYHVAAALMVSSEEMMNIFTHMKLTPGDVDSVVLWLGRLLERSTFDEPYFGGIGRDWANGFTPRLNRFGYNISLSIEKGKQDYGALTNSPTVLAVKNAFSQGATAVALLGPQGIGKTSSVYGLAQLLLAERSDRNLEHRQIVSLNPSFILSSAGQPGQIENIVLSLLAETVHAGHIILFLDDAELFFGYGPGTFDILHILQPIIQARSIQLVLALTPTDFQRLKVQNSTFANLLTPITVIEPDETSVMAVLEDSAISLENNHDLLISYEALKEVYRLSGRYIPELSYPGRAIQLLEQSITCANQGVVSADSVQQAVEQAYGVKVRSLAAEDSESLIHLEDNIHKRMINQKRAVSVVANALRRSRAGVANPRRPIGSFLFLGPTGVGKTELAKAIASVYYGDQSAMIRLDMSEYQQVDDVSRLLSAGTSEAASLLMSVRQQPSTVVLFDEIEKAHPTILNLLLQLLDEGQLTDSNGRMASFKDCIIIATSNAGAQIIRDRVGQGEDLETFESAFIDELMQGAQFKPELLNRFDEIVLFRPLNSEELLQIVGLMMKEVNATLSPQNISINLTAAASKLIVSKGYDARLGARPLRRMLQRMVEDEVANRIISGAIQPGDRVTFDEADLIK
jgi:ATP-dependent Clp protease ATP-binding subunit ClpC